MIDSAKLLNFYKNKTVLITGSSGLLGSHLLDFLVKASSNIHLLTQRPPTMLANHVDFVQGDVRESAVVAKALEGADIVFHLAAVVNVDRSICDPFNTLSTNVMGTLQVLECARKMNKTPSIIFSSSTSVYTYSPNRKITEDCPLTSIDPYSTSKVASELICQSFAKTYGLPVTILRVSSMYGPRQKKLQFIPKVISQSLSSSVLELGSLNAYRDFSYVRDVASAFLLAGAVPEASSQVFNIASGVPLKIVEIVEKILKILGKKLDIKSNGYQRPGEVVFPFFIDSSKAKNVLNWEPCYDIDEGLKETIEWFKNECFKI